MLRFMFYFIFADDFYFVPRVYFNWVMQIIWGGTTPACEPNADIKTKFEANLSHTCTASHWADTTTVRRLIDDLFKNSVVPYCKAQGFDPEKTHWLMLWDCTYLFFVRVVFDAF
jgi:hypothetical protein